RPATLAWNNFARHGSAGTAKIVPQSGPIPLRGDSRGETGPCRPVGGNFVARTADWKLHAAGQLRFNGSLPTAYGIRRPRTEENARRPIVRRKTITGRNTCT